MEQSEVMESTEKGLRIYEYIVNHCDTCVTDMPKLYSELKEADTTGQFMASTARYLSAVDPEGYKGWIPLLVEATIEKDREHKYIGSLLEAIWGKGYQDKVEELRNTDDNFRRIYKRIYPDKEII